MISIFIQLIFFFLISADKGNDSTPKTPRGVRIVPPASQGTPKTLSGSISQSQVGCWYFCVLFLILSRYSKPIFWYTNIKFETILILKFSSFWTKWYEYFCCSSNGSKVMTVWKCQKWGYFVLCFQYSQSSNFEVFQISQMKHYHLHISYHYHQSCIKHC